MDAKLKADWIAALRSGEFKQGHLRLGDKRGYCCLGVLCKVAGYKFKSNDTWLPDTSSVSPDAQNYLVMMNDADCLSFSQIADWLESNPDV